MKARFLSLILGLTATAALLVGFSASSASAQPDQCIAGYGGCYLENLWDGGLLVNGETHNETLYGEPWPNADGYSYVQKDGSWGWMRSNKDPSLCWNEVDKKVYLDSCVAPDAHEYFEFVPSGSYWLIKNYAEGLTLNLAASGDGDNLYFTSGVNDTSLWYDIP